MHEIFFLTFWQWQMLRWIYINLKNKLILLFTRASKQNSIKTILNIILNSKSPIKKNFYEIMLQNNFLIFILIFISFIDDKKQDI